MVVFDEEKQNKRVEELRRGEEEELAKTLSHKYNLPYIDLTTLSVNRDALRVLKEDEARAAGLAVFKIVDKKVQVAVRSPNQEKTKEAVQKLKEAGYIPMLFMVSSASLEKIWSIYEELSFSSETRAGALDISSDEIIKFLGQVKTIADVKRLVAEILSEKSAYRISKILEVIIAGALATKASDIHVEPEDEYARLRYRLDGVLTDVLEFDPAIYNLLLSRIKLLSGAKLNVRGIAQDGRFSIKTGEDIIEVRTSILPGAYNDSIVLRVLNPKAISVPLEELGINPRLLKVLLHAIEKPNGMILTTGPTGSGKTTTLYAFLKKVHSPEIKIITIENPIEYHLPGIVQTQTDKKRGYTFLEGLRSALRQDPDVIMVGEIRDEETAEIAINAALTGHLVFSTLHTNNAAGTFPRLIDLGVNPKVISSALSVSMAQRLVRKLCPDCKKETVLAGRNKELLAKILATIDDRTYLDGISMTKVWESVGCEKCNLTGFRGRVGLFEAILMDRATEEMINKNPGEREIKKAAKPQNILDMAEDAVIKILSGITSIEEVERVIDLESEEK